MKQCKKCKVTKKAEDFYTYKNKTLSTCKNCITHHKHRERRIKYTYSWWYSRYDRLKRQAKKRGKIFELSFSETKILWNLKNCYYCEKLADIQTIDRVDNSKPYTKENCVMACWNCNRRKSTFSLEEIKNFYEKMLKYH